MRDQLPPSSPSWQFHAAALPASSGGSQVQKPKDEQSLVRKYAWQPAGYAVLVGRSASLPDAFADALQLDVLAATASQSISGVVAQPVPLSPW